MEQQTVSVGEVTVTGKDAPERPTAAIIRQAKSELKQMKKYGGLRLSGRRAKEAWLGRRCKELMGIK
jgi:hypothetical protein